MESDLALRVVEALAQLPNVTVDGSQRNVLLAGHQADLTVDATVQGRQVTFLIEIRAAGYPRDAQRAVWVLDTVRHDAGREDIVPMLVAPAISVASRQLLRERGVAYWDASGSFSLDLPWAHYLIDRPAARQAERTRRDIYRGSSAQLLHTLLLNPDRHWHLTELAKQAEVATSTAHQVCTFLERQLWMDREGTGPQSVRILRAPDGLLDAWAAAYTLDRYQHFWFHRWARSRAELLDPVVSALSDAGIEYALTLESGSSLVAPYATPTDRVWAVIHSSVMAQLEAVTAQAGLRRVEEGERVTFLVSRDRSPLMFRRQIDGFWVVSDVQLYLDLWAWPMRGQEQARHLRAERLSY